jgi:hypothetical protein
MSFGVVGMLVCRKARHVRAHTKPTSTMDGMTTINLSAGVTPRLFHQLSDMTKSMHNIENIAVISGVRRYIAIQEAE